MDGADDFLGLSGPGVLKPKMLKAMGETPLVLALANPTPEIMPEEAKSVRPDAIICTGRSDYPNQVNNVLCFPSSFAARWMLGRQRSTSPILIGRPAVIEQRVARFGLTLDPSRDFEIINPEDDPRYRDYVALFHSLVGRSGVTPETARSVVRTNTTVIGALAVKRREADGLICGLQGRYTKHLRHIRSIIGSSEDVVEEPDANEGC
ncbi:malic enzyme [Mesorhizobium alhagi CCNWXJ12-2]|uniref:Malic enzyme n=1 Tax=Mesorhizobium alhagi CCNWXJ12-2 TaxID=1107882 RepID=H0I0T9_9HYPH|nr:malic enzyme [Mesorhizobium alhagi CCNWXJ12-2]